MGEHNIELLGLDIHNPVFLFSSIYIGLFVILTLVFPESARQMFDLAKGWSITHFDWLFMLGGNFFVLFCLLLVVSPLARIRLGGEDATPEFSRLAWFCMLFAAGMGIGLMFWSVAEPVGYFTDWAGTPLNTEPYTTTAARMALGATLFHWGLHPWAIYAVVGLSLAFFSHNCHMPLTLRSTFFPLLGERVWGASGNLIDTVAVLATIFGLATSLGFGAQQAAGGLYFLFGIPNTISTQVAIIFGVTLIAIVSVVRGLERGVKILSGINMSLAALLMVFVINSLDSLIRLYTVNLGITPEQVGKRNYILGNATAMLTLIMLYQFTPFEIEWVGLVVIALYGAIYVLLYNRSRAPGGTIDMR